jgi:hypothetical protein
MGSFFISVLIVAVGFSFLVTFQTTYRTATGPSLQSNSFSNQVGFGNSERRDLGAGGRSGAPLQTVPSSTWGSSGEAATSFPEANSSETTATLTVGTVPTDDPTTTGSIPSSSPSGIPQEPANSENAGDATPIINPPLPRPRVAKPRNQPRKPPPPAAPAPFGLDWNPNYQSQYQPPLPSFQNNWYEPTQTNSSQASQPDYQNNWFQMQSPQPNNQNNVSRR